MVGMLEIMGIKILNLGTTSYGDYQVDWLESSSHDTDFN